MEHKFIAIFLPHSYSSCHTGFLSGEKCDVFCHVNMQYLIIVSRYWEYLDSRIILIQYNNVTFFSAGWSNVNASNMHGFGDESYPAQISENVWR